MRDELATTVLPFFRSALDIRDGWLAGTGPAFDAGRAALVGRLGKVHKVCPPVAPEPSAGHAPADLLGTPAGGDDGDEKYLGVSYPLACWADELFTLDSPAAAAWNERKFEAEFHRANDRAWRFWRQAGLAAGLPAADDLEVFFLCSALGFRGEWADDPARLRGWFEATRERLAGAGKRDDWAGPPVLDPPLPPTPRTARAAYRRMAVAAGAAAVLAIPAAAWLVARRLGW